MSGEWYGGGYAGYNWEKLHVPIQGQSLGLYLGYKYPLFVDEGSNGSVWKSPDWETSS